MAFRTCRSSSSIFPEYRQSLFPWFRFYGPEKALFHKSWTMSDIEMVT
jgi:hypothetical protein